MQTSLPSATLQVVRTFRAADLDAALAAELAELEARVVDVEDVVRALEEGVEAAKELGALHAPLALRRLRRQLRLHARTHDSQWGDVSDCSCYRWYGLGANDAENQ